MPTFHDLRDQLGALRDQQRTLRADLLAAREDVKRGRRASAKDVERLEALQRGLDAQDAVLWKDFAVHTDPKETVAQLEDRHPILLFPLRLETRFKSSAQGQPQLWVRVYPDECLVDAFEPSLTEAEVKNAQIFWAHVWRAGGVQARERAAWRDLAASHGVGRAGWIVGQYKPLNEADKPARDAASDVLLIVPTFGAAPAPLSATAIAFWTAVWKAGGDAAAVQSALPALQDDLGDAAAQALIDAPPMNLSELPAEGTSRAATAVKVTALRFTALADMPARRASWSSAPRVDLLPEKLLLMGYRGSAVALERSTSVIRTPLAAGPDPNAAPTEQLSSDGDTLTIPEALRWMFDFEAALAAGMAFRIDLTPDQAARGFDKIVVLGVRVADDAARGRANLEQLIEHHLHSRPGLSIVPQGTPTNHTEKAAAGARYGDDPEAGFDAFFLRRPLYTPQADPLLRRDGQWLADTLGLSHGLAQRIPNAEGEDGIDARAMNLALWPGTMGYMLRTMMQPVFAERDIDATRQFLSRYAIARGWIPALRVGDQPYGVLPCTAFARIDWFGERPGVNPVASLAASSTNTDYLRRLHRLLGDIDTEWAALRQRVSHVGQTGRDPHQVLLDVLGLHPASVEYHPLKAESAEQHFHHLSLINFPIALAFIAAFVAKDDAMRLLREFGYSGAAEPEAITKLFSSKQPRLDGPVIDEPPLSETEGLTKVAAGANYIEWLVKAAATDLETLQEERGFDAGKRPRALLYLMLRHAMQLSYHLVGAKQRAKAQPEPERALATLLTEPKYVHVASGPAPSESRYAVLMDDAPVTGATLAGAKSVRMADHIARNLRRLDPELTEQADALDRLAGASTARLERAFAEHIDSCSHRLDAWKQGLLHWQLERMRASGGRGQGTDGLYLGAFGWLEDVRPENKNLQPITLPPDVAKQVDRPGDPPLVRDPTNAGLVHAPSLNQATTAAVLRNGYLSHDGRLAVDLSSRRVRLAMDILEGLRNGQPLGALLGYHFERHLHDSATITVRALSFELRRQFPLVANRIASTQDPTQAIEAIAAMNVVDGLKLVRHVEKAATKTYPWDLTGVPAPVPASLGPIVDAAAAHIADINDAVADLVLAEGVHQAVNGNYDRSAATLDAFSKGNYPAEPEVVKTPRTGTALVLRTGLHLDPNAPAPAVATPLARAEPAVDAWLARHLPAPGDVGCHVKYTRRDTGAADTVFITQAQLGLAPSDLVYLLDANHDAGLRLLDDRILAQLHAGPAPPHLNAPIAIAYTERVAGKVTWFELEALLASLRTLVTTSRPLQPADVLRTNDAKAPELPASTLDAAPLIAVREELRTVRLPALTALEAALAAGPIDAAIDAYVAEFSRLALYRLQQTGTGFAYEWRSGFYATLQKKLDTLRTTWTTRLADATQRLTDYDTTPPPTEAEQIAWLQAAEMLVGTSYFAPQPATAAASRTALGAKRDDFAAKLAQLDAIATTRHASVDAFLQALLSHDLSPYDFDGLKLDADVAEVERCRQQLIAGVKALNKDLADKKFSAEADALLAGTPTAAQVQAAAQGLFGEDFKMVPRFVLPPAARTALAAAWTQSTSGGLTRYLVDTVGREAPVDDWLHSVARVREKMHHWENALMLCEAFGTPAPELTPLQLPAVAGEPWFAMEVPPPTVPGERAMAGDRLLYTAHFTQALDASQPVCGLLVDEWTEVIPEDTETTGVAFHHDRPNSEPPQTWLLALPALTTGAWSWDELLDAVNDALESAKRRAIEPDHVQGTRYGWLLPATYAAYTFPEISISNHLLRNVRIFDKVVVK